MAPVNLGNRTPTVQRYRQRWWSFGRSPAEPVKSQRKTTPIQASAQKSPTSGVPAAPALKPAKATTYPAAKPNATLAGWLAREAIALVGMGGAALTVLAQLAWFVPMSAPFLDVLGTWMTYNSNFWLTNYDRLGFYPHSHLQAAIALAIFLTLIGLGARVSARLSGRPHDRNWGLFDGMTWPSLVIMSILGVVFLLGHDPDPSRATYDDAGGKETVKYLFAVILAAGYGLGDYLGQKGFHTRLYRLAVLIILLLGLNHWLLISR